MSQENRSHVHSTGRLGVGLLLLMGTLLLPGAAVSRAEGGADVPGLTHTPQMAFRPAPDATTLSSFVPGGTPLTAVPTTPGIPADSPAVKRSQDNGFIFDNGRVAIVLEPETVPARTFLRFTAWPVPPPPITATNTLSDPLASLTLLSFSVDAIDPFAAVTPLEKPARIVVDVRGLTGGLNPVYSRYFLAYRDPADPARLHEVPLVVHQADGLLSAEVAHFSDWVAGVRPERWTPEWTPPAVSEFSGAATYSYPLALPPGRAGHQPAVVFNYSSRTLDGRIRDGRPQALADGWSLASIEIVREGVKLRRHHGLDQTYHPDKFRLVLNGTGHKLHPDPATPTTADTLRYYAKDAPGLLVYRRFRENAPNAERLYWVVITPDGTRYRLGWTADAETWQAVSYFARLWVDGHPGRLPVDGQDTASAVAWSVDTVTDMFGNQITYDYFTREYGELIQWVNANGQISQWTLTTRQNRLRAIHYNFPERIPDPPANHQVERLDPATAVTRIEFWATSGDANNSFRDPISRIFVFHGPGQSTPIAEYRLDQGGIIHESENCRDEFDRPRGTETRLLNRIRHFAATDADPTTDDPGFALPPITFGYQLLPHFTKNDGGCFAFAYLSQVNNGYGGEITFEYTSDDRSVGIYQLQENNGTYYFEWPKIGYSYFVTRQNVRDGRGAPAIVDFAYDAPCYGQWSDAPGHLGNLPGATRCNPDDGPELGNLAGFATTTRTVRAADGTTALARQVSTFSQSGRTTVGRPILVEQQDGAGAPFACQATTYATRAIGGVAELYSFASSEETRQLAAGDDCAGTPAAATLHSRVTYNYDDFGNQIESVDYGDVSTAVDDLTSHRVFYPDTYLWLVGQVAEERIYEGSVALTLRRVTRTYYDDQGDHTASPTQGAVTFTESGLPGAAIDGGVAGFVPGQRVQYSPFGNVITTTTPSGAQTTIAYDGSARLYPVTATTTGPDLPPRTIAFDIYGFNSPLDGFQVQTGLLKGATDPNGVTTLYEFDPFGRFWASYERPGDRGDVADRADGNPLQRLRYWDNEWNYAGLTFLEPDQGRPFHIAVQSRPNEYTVAGDGYHLRTYTFYDGLGRLIQEQSPLAAVEGQPARRDIVSITGYDVRGQADCVTVPFGVPNATDRGLAWDNTPFYEAACESRPHTATTFDAQGRPRIVTHHDGTQTMTYYQRKGDIVVDGLSRLLMVQLVDANGHITNRFFDGRDRLRLVREFDAVPSPAADTRYHYDWAGNLTDVFTAASSNQPPPVSLRHSSLTYDPLGRKATMVDPDMGLWTYHYDAAGNLTMQVDNGRRLCLDYDSLDRVTARRAPTAWSAGSDPCASTQFNALASYTYDEAPNGMGLPATISWNGDLGRGEDAFAYDDLGRPISQTRMLEDSSYTLLTNGYDPLARPTGHTYPDGSVVALEYDREGAERLTVDGLAIVDGVGYNDRGQLVLLNRAQVADSTWDYDLASFRLASITHGGHNDSWADFTFGYDAVGNITSLTTSESGVSDVQTFTYDHRDRLLTAVGSGATLLGTTITPAYEHNYSYDRLGNITGREEDGTFISYGYEGHSPHAVTSLDSGYDFTYDERGNMIERYTPAGHFGQEFDGQNRMTAVTVEDGRTANFAYDSGEGRTTAVHTTPGESRRTVYTPFPGYEVERRETWACPAFSGKGSCQPQWVLESEVRRLTVAVAGQVVATRIDTTPVGEPTSRTWAYAFHDHLGSAAVLSDENGLSIAGSRARYLPFGAYRGAPPATNPDLLDTGFTGHKHEDALGLIYMKARYYVPASGRFASADTLIPDPANPQTYNRYAYTNNNPLNHTDPTGHCAEGTMGDDYEDYDCLMIAQRVAHKYKWSFNKLARYNWRMGRRLPNAGNGRYYPVRGGNEIIGYELVELDGRKALVEGNEVFDLTMGDGEDEMRALVAKSSAVASEMESFKRYADAHSSAQESYRVHATGVASGVGGIATSTLLLGLGSVPTPASFVALPLGATGVVLSSVKVISDIDQLFIDANLIEQNSIRAENAIWNLIDPESSTSSSTLAVDISWR